MALTHTETEEIIKTIDRILEDYDRLIQFLYKYENENIQIHDCKSIFMRNLYHIEVEDILQEIKSELEIV